MQISNLYVFAPANQIQIHSPVFDLRSKYSPRSRAGSRWMRRHIGAKQCPVRCLGRRAPVVMARVTAAHVLSTVHVPGVLRAFFTRSPVRASALLVALCVEKKKSI